MDTLDPLEIDHPRKRFLDTHPEVKQMLKRVSIPLLIILCGFILHKLLVWMRYTPPKTAVVKTALLVSAYPIKATVERAHVVGYGEVEPSRQLEMRAQVSGHVTALSSGLEIGGRVKKGAILVTIDPRDYEIAIEAEKANVTRAEFELELERGSQVVARREWDLLSKDLKSGEIGESLALRKPHLREKQAALEAAKSRLKKAHLDLERTKIVSPFNGVVLQESVEIGKYITPQTEVVKLAATNQFFVRVRVPKQALHWLKVKDARMLQEHEVILFEGDESNGTRRGWKARIVRLLSDVDAAGRMAQILVAVNSPLDPPKGNNPLLLGSFVKAEIKGRSLKDVFRIPRTAVREGSVLWAVSKDGTLELVPVTIVQSRDEVALVRGDLHVGQMIVTSPLQGALEGAKVRVADEEF